MSTKQTFITTTNPRFNQLMRPYRALKQHMMKFNDGIGLFNQLSNRICW